MRLILALFTIYSLSLYAAEEAPVVPPIANAPVVTQPAPAAPVVDKTAQFSSDIKAAVDAQYYRADKAQRCCAGQVGACTLNKATAQNIKTAKSDLKADSSKMGTQGSAVAMGDFADNLKDVGNGLVRACTDMGNSCMEVGVTMEQSLRAQCPDCDLSALRAETARCPLKGRTEQQVREYPATKPVPQPGGYEPRPGNGETIPVPVVDARGPVVIENGNSEWRKGLGNDRPNWRDDKEQPAKDKSEQLKAEKEKDGSDKLSGLSNSFAKMGDKSGGAGNSNFKGSSVGSEGIVGMPNAANYLGANAQTEPIGLFPSIGSVGMREPARRANGARNSAATARNVSAGSNAVPVAGLGNAQPHRGAVGFAPASGGGSAQLRAPQAGGSQISHGQQVAAAPLKQPNIAAQSLGGTTGTFKPSSAAVQNHAPANLGDYLPNGRLSPQSRGIAGATNSQNPQILSQGKDVWENMSTRMQHFCKMGRLYDCN